MSETSRHPSSGFFLAVRLAVADFRHEWPVSLCQSLAFAAAMTPLLLLFGLKSGVVSTLRERLLADPHVLELSIVGSHRLDHAWFSAMRSDPKVGFIVPRTRSLAATIDMRSDAGQSLAGVEMIPTAPGDPLAPEESVVPPAASDVLLSASAAARLRVKSGETVIGQIARTLDGQRQASRVSLHVRAVLPEQAFSRDGAFVSLTLLSNAEEYREGVRSSLLDGDGDNPPKRRTAFAGARLFASTLENVAPLAGQLRSQGLEVRTRAAEIASVQALDAALGRVVLILAAIACSGFLLSLALSLWANVERKRQALALLRLIGFGGLAVTLFPATQALLTALSGILLSLGSYGVVASIVNAAFASTLAAHETACRLAPKDAIIGTVFTLVLALLSSSLGGRRAARIEPAESLRHV